MALLFDWGFRKIGFLEVAYILVSNDIFLFVFPATAGDGKNMKKFIAHGYIYTWS